MEGERVYRHGTALRTLILYIARPDIRPFVTSMIPHGNFALLTCLSGPFLCLESEMAYSNAHE